MAGRKQVKNSRLSAGTKARRTFGKGALFPAPLPRSATPAGYAKTLIEIKQRIQRERLRVVMAANVAMVLLYWDVRRMILDRQEREG